MTGDTLQRDDVAREAGLPPDRLDLIKENQFCFVLRAAVNGRRMILKKYKHHGIEALRDEAAGLEFYHRIAAGEPDLIDSNIIRSDPAQRWLLMKHVDGECLRDLVYRARREPRERDRSVRVMSVLGRLLRKMFEKSRVSGEPTADFIFHYLRHCSEALERIPILGRATFRGLRTDAEWLAHRLRRSDVAPSFSHGDFVFRNIHVDGERVGLIDFSHANPRGHLLNDLHNLRFALHSMMVSASFRKALWGAFTDGLGEVSFPEVAHHFYYEVHRRRWLMLKLRSGGPLGWIQGIRGMATFARPFGGGGFE